MITSTELLTAIENTPDPLGFAVDSVDLLWRMNVLLPLGLWEVPGAA